MSVFAGACEFPAQSDATLKIEGFVWNDLNLNGLQESNEKGIPGVLVTLFEDSGKNVGETITDSQGNYLFTENLQTGLIYWLMFTPASPFTIMDTGDDSVDSDVDPNTAQTEPFRLESSSPGADFDAGLILPEDEVATQTPTPTPTDAPAETPTPTQTFTPTPLAYGPDEFPPDVDPLTCLVSSSPEILLLPPALISITNFPENARPQAGLDWAAWILEGYIGEGMTRFLVIFHGQYPQALPGEGMLDDPQIGPIRSGRLWYEDVRQLLNGFIIMASAGANTRSQLSSFTNIFGSDEGDINSAFIPILQLQQIAQNNQNQLGNGALSGNACSELPPQGGEMANSLWVRWSFLNQEFFRFDAQSAAYNLYQNDTVEGNIFTQATDRLNGNPLTFENVIILFANYTATSETAMSIELLDVTRPGMAFRDGKVYQIQWTTRNSEYEFTTGKRRPIRFMDAEGNPFPLKPGQTWVLIMPTWTQPYETVDSQDYMTRLRQVSPGSGHWAVIFYPPKIQ